MISLGLAGGCGDDGTPSTSGATNTQTSMTGVTSVDTMGSTADMTASSTQPTTTEGSGSMTSASSSTTDEPTTSPTTGMVTATMGTSTTVSTTDAMTTDMSTTSTSTDSDGTSTTTTTSDGTSSSTSGSSSSSSTSTTSDSGTTEDIPCDEQQVVLNPVTPNIMLVLDKSGSMLNTWDHDANANTPPVTRWFSLYAVVDSILTAVQDDFNFGMKLFPSKTATGNYDATACTTPANVEVTVQPFAKAQIMAALPAQMNMSIQGGTPAADGMSSAISHLKTLDPMIPRAVLLVTDGAANCGDPPLDLFEDYDDALHTIVGNAYNNDGIPTYVIGIAIANAVSPDAPDGNPDLINPYDKLNMLATQGGTAKPGPEKFYSADNQLELQAALDAIINDALSCVIPLDPEPGFPDFTKVKVGNNYVNKINDCATENGWKYVNANPPFNAIELCGTACNALKQTGEAGVEYYCMPG